MFPLHLNRRFERSGLMHSLAVMWLIWGSLVAAGITAQPSASPGILKYGDGKADGRKSLGGSGEMIRFSMPAEFTHVRAVKIHGSRYGLPQPPDEDFEVIFLSGDREEVLHTEAAPYRLFKRGTNRWVSIPLKTPLEITSEFWIVLDFHAQQTKGVYVSYDTSTGGEHSRIGLAGDDDPKVTDFQGDWMVQVLLTKE